MRFIRVDHEPELGLSVGAELSRESPRRGSHQSGALAVGPPHLLRRPLAAWAFTSRPARHHLLGLHRLPETPESLGPRSVDAGGVCGDEER